MSGEGEGAEVVVLSECPALDAGSQLLEGVTAAILAPDQDPLSLDPAPDLLSLCVQNAELSAGATTVFAYFETIPNVSTADAFHQLCASPDTVLSSALSSQPIASTLPIVSKHVPAAAAPQPASLLLTLERLDTDEGEGDDGQSEDGLEPQEQQLEEHW